MREIFLDTEPTGLSAENDRIVEIACVETRGLIPTKRVFHKVINPKIKVGEDAFKVHGFSNEFLSSKPIFDEIAIDFVNFIKGKKLIIHNAPFDVGFLNNELQKVNQDKIEMKNVIDSLELARAKFPGTSNSLDALCRRFNISLVKRVKHNALLDCELLREVYINLVDAKEPKLVFTPNTEKSAVNDIKFSKNYSKKIINISKEELTKHQDFIKRDLKKNFY